MIPKKECVKFVTSAHVVVTTFDELNVGDKILWLNWSRKITKINKYDHTIDVTNPFDESVNTLSFRVYYVIKNCIMKDFIPENEFDFSNKDVSEYKM